jgi:type VI secretion system VasD/TssJ family lipoprotein
MKKPLCVIPLLLALLFVFSCAEKPILPPQYSFGKAAIHLDIKAEPQLNTFEGSPHTLLLCIYQLTDPNAFNQLTGDEDGLYKLLECTAFDPSVTNIRRLIVRPAQATTIVLDRAEGTKYLGLVAGYSVIQKNNMIRLIKIPIVVEKQGYISQTRIAKPGPLNLEIQLGPKQIGEIKTGVSSGKKD